MGRIANILDLSLNQKLAIASACLSVEFLCQLAVKRGEPDVKKQTLDFLKNYFGPEISEVRINSLLTEFLDSSDSLTL